jgi:hypothetical protein
MFVCLEKITHFNLVLVCACFVLVIKKKKNTIRTKRKSNFVFESRDKIPVCIPIIDSFLNNKIKSHLLLTDDESISFDYVTHKIPAHPSVKHRFYRPLLLSEKKKE